jgi:nucleotide-binding universal stress UspA family protein
MKTILVPTDFSDNAMHAACYAATLARVYHNSITFINIYRTPIVLEYDVLSNLNPDSYSEIQKSTELKLKDFTNVFISNLSSIIKTKPIG